MRNHENLQIARVNSRAILHLRSWMLRHSSPFIIPPSLIQHGRLLTLAPGEWLLISDTLSAQTLHEHARLAREQGIVAVSSSPALAAIRIEGRAARGVLAKSCGLDFHPSIFPVGSCTRTRLAKLPAIVDFVDVKPRFELYVGCSYLAYMCSCLNDASVGYLESVDRALNT